MTDSYTYAIVLLLPLAAAMVVFQANPYQALIMRGILGAIAALIYAMLGGADVALTEALVGTMLAVTLYVVAVRSSLVMRLGILAAERQGLKGQPLLDYLRSLLKRYQLRLELVPYDDDRALEQALAAKDVHGICHLNGAAPQDDEGAPHLRVRVRRLHDIFATELPKAIATSRLDLGDEEQSDRPASLQTPALTKELP
jgi:putative multicomponent Na+:H+ antiporter subunit B